MKIIKNKKPVSVIVEFEANSLNTMFKVTDRLERMAEKKFKGIALGAGYGGRVRDMSFEFKKKKDAKAFKKEAKKIKSVKFTEFKIK